MCVLPLILLEGYFQCGRTREEPKSKKKTNFDQKITKIPFFKVENPQKTPNFTVILVAYFMML